MKGFRTSVAFLAALIAVPASAASDGTLGPTSTGTFTVTATISAGTTDNVRVFGLDDFSFSGSEGDTINNQEKPFCLTRTTPGPLTLTISSFTNAGEGFYVRTPGGANQIQMNVSVFDQNDGQYHQLTESLGTEFDADGNCTENPGDGATRLLSISLLNTATATPGNYSGAFLVTVAAQ